MSYSTALGLRYPLISQVHLDQEYRGEGVYAPDGNEGEWYVAGWSGKDGIRLSQDRDLALVGVWEYCAAEQRVLGSRAWERCQREERERYPHLPARNTVYARSADLGPTIPRPGMLVAYHERESWGSGEYEDYRPGETLADLLRVNPHAATLRKEWAVGEVTSTPTPYRYLLDTLPHRLVFGMVWVLWTRYVRRGVAEPWAFFGGFQTEHEALEQIDGSACPLCPALALIQQVRREGADSELLRAQEAREREEARERARQHRHASEGAFDRLLEGKDAAGRELARRWRATITELSKPEHEELRGRLKKHKGFTARYEAVFEAERVPAKRRAVREWLEWIEREVGVRVEAQPEQEQPAKETT